MLPTCCLALLCYYRHHYASFITHWLHYVELLFIYCRPYSNLVLSSAEADKIGLSTDIPWRAVRLFIYLFVDDSFENHSLILNRKTETHLCSWIRLQWIHPYRYIRSCPVSSYTRRTCTHCRSRRSEHTRRCRCLKCKHAATVKFVDARIFIRAHGRHQVQQCNSK